MGWFRRSQPTASSEDSGPGDIHVVASSSAYTPPPTPNGTGTSDPVAELTRDYQPKNGASKRPAHAPLKERLTILSSAVEGTRRSIRAADVRKILNLVGMLCVGFGVALVIFGWYGAAHSPYLFQEVPYLISGGLLGVALVVVGAILIGSSWVLRLVQEDRRNAVALARSIERLERAVRAASATNFVTEEDPQSSRSGGSQ
jgi:hypothetical protein